MKKVSIIIPCYNEQESLPLLYNALCELAQSPGGQKYDWEFFFINDGSKDNTLNVLRDLHSRDARCCYVDFSRNFGKENAMLAGFDYVSGDCAVIMDADLQHPPMAALEMLEKWEEGYEDVYAKRRSRGKESWLRKRLSLRFYKILNKMSNVEMLQNVGDFRLLDHRCIDALKNLRESERYTKGLFCWIGYRKAEIMFDTVDRVAGETSWNMGKLFKFAMKGIMSFSTSPLHLATWTGLIVSVIAFIYMLFIFVKALMFGDPVAGFPTIMCVILLLGGIQLLCIGIIGEYVAVMFNETKNRPVYIVREHNGERI